MSLSVEEVEPGERTLPIADFLAGIAGVLPCWVLNTGLTWTQAGEDACDPS